MEQRAGKLRPKVNRGKMVSKQATDERIRPSNDWIASGRRKVFAKTGVQVRVVDQEYESGSGYNYVN